MSSGTTASTVTAGAPAARSFQLASGSAIGRYVILSPAAARGHTTLKVWQETRARGWREVRDAYLAAGRGLAAAHEAGIVHRDFEPSNVLVSHDVSLVKVTDFGIARALDTPERDPEPQPERPAEASVSSSLASRLTETGALLGTPSYMSPEQFRGEPTDARTDQFSFCAALYEALHGVRAFGGDTLEELAASVLAGRVAEPPDGGSEQ